MNNSTTNWPSIDFHERLPIYYVMWNGGRGLQELLCNVEWVAGGVLLSYYNIKCGWSSKVTENGR